MSVQSRSPCSTSAKTHLGLAMRDCPLLAIINHKVHLIALQIPKHNRRNVQHSVHVNTPMCPNQTVCLRISYHDRRPLQVQRRLQQLRLGLDGVPAAYTRLSPRAQRSRHVHDRHDLPYIRERIISRAHSNGGHIAQAVLHASG